VTATVAALQPRLRQLHLSGMLDVVAARLDEARSRKLDPLDFLALLLDDEIARRDNEGVARRIRNARFEDVCDLRDFDFAYNPEIPQARLWELATGRFVEERASVILCGPTGVGKSFVAQALGVAACRQHRRVLFTKTTALLADLAGGRADGSWQPRLRRYLGPDLLVLDDFGMREYTAQQAEDLYELVNRRYRRGSLVLTTNRAPKDLYALFPNPVLAEGLLDRLLNSAHVVEMLGRSYRPRLRPGGPADAHPADDPAADDRGRAPARPGGVR
jgi:DNA replication protein DnaC